MSRTHFDGPLASGDKQAGTPGGANVGLAVLAQQVTLQRDATLVQTATINLPAGSQILDIIPDVVVAYDSATSAGLTVGTPGAPPAYVAGVNAKTIGRAAPVFTGGQLLAMNPTTLVVGPSLEVTAEKLLNNLVLASGESNITKGKYKLIVSPYLE